MSLKAKIEAVIYAAEEPVTLAQLAALFQVEVLEAKQARLSAEAASREAEAIAEIAPADITTDTTPEGATDAALTPYHIERGKLFVRERFAKNRHIAVEVLCANIEYTRFPVPIENEREAATDYPALLRASDLIGQLADPNYMRKIAALFAEFAETGMNETLGYDSSAGLRAAYPKFFWSTVTPYIEDALNDLRMTQDGQLWVANLYSHVFAEEHKLPALGAERIRD